MTLRPRLLALALLLSPLPLLAADAPAKYRSAQEILDASPASDWHSPAPENLLYMDLDGGRVIIELAPQFAPEHAGNIRTLAREGFWNGTSIYRSQDNFVVQFGDADADDAGKAKPLGSAKTHLPAEFQRPAVGQRHGPDRGVEAAARVLDTPFVIGDRPFCRRRSRLPSRGRGPGRVWCP